jgi:hypothetical protein
MAESKRKPVQYLVSKLEIASNTPNECVYFADDEDLKREVLELSNRISKIIDKVAPKPSPIARAKTIR